MEWKLYIPALLAALVATSWGEACPDTFPDYCQTYYDGTTYQCCCTLSTDGTTYIDTCNHSLFVLSLSPDSLVALRISSFNYNPDATHGMDKKGFVSVHTVTPDSLVALRISSFRYEPLGTTIKRNRKLFVLAWGGKIYVLTEPPFGWFTADDTLYFSADSFLWAPLSTHTLDLPDTLQLVPDSLQRRFWYHFLYWTSDRGDTNTSKQWEITVPSAIGLGGVTYTVHFDVDPAIRSRLKGGLWFDPRGCKKGFNPHE